MENKEPKIFKALVHKETGVYGEIQDCEVYSSDVPELFFGQETYEFLEARLRFNDYKLKEVVVISLEEYQRLTEGK